MSKWIPLVHQSGPLAITDLKGTLLLGAISANNKIDIEQSCKFSLLPVQYEKDGEFCWIRNGLAITKRGDELVIYESACVNMEGLEL